MRLPVLLALTALALPSFAQKDPAKETPAKEATADIAKRTASMTAMPGLLPLHWDAVAGKLYLEIPHLEQDLLYTHGLPYGTGSNDLGLDRGQVSGGVIVRFERFGPKILLIQPNEAFRSSSTDPAEQLSVRQSFPESVLAGFKVEAEDKSGAVLVDATDFFLRDAHGVGETLTHLQQGSYKLDPARSSIALDHTKVFPKNTEVEALLTFTNDVPSRRGTFVDDVTPDPHAMTIREHQSFMELPGPGFAPRRFDPRAGYFPVSYRDYSVPLGDSLDQQFIIRHRLVRKDHACRSVCEAETPIQYWVDRGAPEPIRSALVEGARWWDQAFQAAGWAPGTFKVDILPADADPMDLRYNIIQWVHRYTRGWSYGEAVTDPRTGEIVKGNVTLGSLRGRQDYLIAEALLAPYAKGRKFTPETDPMLQMVLARIRQLAAHETGHTLGLSHNFAASAFSQGASVMDYPHPFVTVGKDGVPDLSHAYATGIGLWDKVAIDYGYQEFPARSDEHEELNKILAASEKTGLIYITDEDARPFGGAHPHAHLWDNGADPADELTRVLEVRKAALARFGEDAIKPSTPLAQLEDTLVPLYLFHRYQTEAAIKVIGGLNYTYSVRGDGQKLPEIVSPEDQRKALAAVMETLSPETLTLPESILRVLPPRTPGLPRTRESLPADTGLTFDPISSAESAADLTLQMLFNAQRASRLVEYHARNPQEPSLDDVIEAAINAATPAGGASGLPASVGRAVHARVVEWLLVLAANPQASSEARAITRNSIEKLKTTLETSVTGLAEAARIEQFLQDPAKFVPAKPIDAPPGMPIGEEDF